MEVHKDKVTSEKNHKTINHSVMTPSEKDCKVTNNFTVSRTITSDFAFVDIAKNASQPLSADTARDVNLEYNIIKSKAYSAAFDDVYNMVQDAVYYSSMWNRICSIVKMKYMMRC